jgi:hypothetical protein
MYFSETGGKRKLLPLACTIAIGSALFYSPAPAKAGPAFRFISPPMPTGLSLANPPFTLGWSFTLSKSYIVDALGLFDSGGDGFVDSHDIGLWDSTGNLLVSVTGVTGDTHPFVGGFRYVSLSSGLSLAPGEYYVGATYLSGSDPNVFPGEVTTIAPLAGVTFGANRFASGSSLIFPAPTISNEFAYFGPNLNLEVPGPLPIFGAAAAFGFSRKLRKRIKSSAFN